MVNDTISDILTRIRNANLIKSQTVSIPLTRISKQICEILEKQGFIESFQIFSSPIDQFKQNSNTQKKTETTKTTSSASLTRDSIDLLSKTQHEDQQKKFNNHKSGITIYLKYYGREKRPCITNLKRISKPGLRIYANHKEIPKVLGGMGIAILSTSKGIMTDKEARFRGIGGEILCSIW